MPYKHQTASYRTIKGKKWVAYQDVPSTEVHEVLANLRVTRSAVAKSIGQGMHRVFVLPEQDLTKDRGV